MQVNDTEEITIKVDEETAEAYKASPEEEQRLIPILLKLWLKGGKPTPESLKRTLDVISTRAEARGLTQELLDEILNEA